MAKTRLNQSSRRELRNFAKKSVSAPKEQRVMEAAYSKAAPLVRKVVDAKYPPADMEVLRKYGAGRDDSCIRGANPDGVFVGFDFLEGDELIPYLPRGYCASRSYKLPAATFKVINDYSRAKDAHGKAVEVALQDYFALIEGSRTFEDVVAVWPAAAPIFSMYSSGTSLPATLSEEAIARIQETNFGADQEAA